MICLKLDPTSSYGWLGRCFLTTLTRLLFFLIAVHLIPFFHGVQALHAASCLDVPSNQSKLRRILGMRSSFICSSAFAPRFFPNRKCFRHSTSRKLPVRTSTTRASVTKGEVISPQFSRNQSTIACVGDIHGQWDDIDESALRNLKPDLVLFVGDYGDEDVNITRRIAAFVNKVNFGVATVFGNHDAFYTQSHTGRRRAPYNKAKICRVTEQMGLLAPYDVSYRSTPFDDVGISVCGGRSFSVGGPNWKYDDFYQQFVGVYSLSHSASKMMDAVTSSKHEIVVFLSHSGPVGLGDKPTDPCGKDWGKNPGGDYGDQDLREAIERAREQGFRVPLVVFGHMHKRLTQRQGNRTMLKKEPDGKTGYDTVMLNAAVCPRHKVGSRSSYSLRHFQLVKLGGNGYVEDVREAWVSASGEIVENAVLFSVDLQNEETSRTEEQLISENVDPRSRVPAS